MRDGLDMLLDGASRKELSLRESLTLLCEAEIAHREERRIQVGMGIAKFSFMRTLEGFNFDAQPSIDPKQIRDLAGCRWVNNGNLKGALQLLLGRSLRRWGWPRVRAAPASASAADSSAAPRWDPSAAHGQWTRIFSVCGTRPSTHGKI